MIKCHPLRCAGISFFSPVILAQARIWRKTSFSHEIPDQVGYDSLFFTCYIQSVIPCGVRESLFFRLSSLRRRGSGEKHLFLTRYPIRSGMTVFFSPAIYKASSLAVCGNLFFFRPLYTKRHPLRCAVHHRIKGSYLCVALIFNESVGPLTSLKLGGVTLFYCSQGRIAPSEIAGRCRQ